MFSALTLIRTPLASITRIHRLRRSRRLWDWFLNPASKRRFKPRIKLYEVY